MKIKAGCKTKGQKREVAGDYEAVLARLIAARTESGLTQL